MAESSIKDLQPDPGMDQALDVARRAFEEVTGVKAAVKNGQIVSVDGRKYTPEQANKINELLPDERPFSINGSGQLTIDPLAVLKGKEKLQPYKEGIALSLNPQGAAGFTEIGATRSDQAESILGINLETRAPATPENNGFFSHNGANYHQQIGQMSADSGLIRSSDGRHPIELSRMAKEKGYLTEADIEPFLPLTDNNQALNSSARSTAWEYMRANGIEVVRDENAGAAYLAERNAPKNSGTAVSELPIANKGGGEIDTRLASDLNAIAGVNVFSVATSGPDSGKLVIDLNAMTPDVAERLNANKDKIAERIEQNSLGATARASGNNERKESIEEQLETALKQKTGENIDVRIVDTSLGPQFRISVDKNNADAALAELNGVTSQSTFSSGRGWRKSSNGTELILDSNNAESYLNDLKNASPSTGGQDASGPAPSAPTPPVTDPAAPAPTIPPAAPAEPSANDQEPQGNRPTRNAPANAAPQQGFDNFIMQIIMAIASIFNPDLAEQMKTSMSGGEQNTGTTPPTPQASQSTLPDGITMETKISDLLQRSDATNVLDAIRDSMPESARNDFGNLRQNLDTNTTLTVGGVLDIVGVRESYQNRDPNTPVPQARSNGNVGITLA